MFFKINLHRFNGKFVNCTGSSTHHDNRLINKGFVVENHTVKAVFLSKFPSRLQSVTSASQ